MAKSYIAVDVLSSTSHGDCSLGGISSRKYVQLFVEVDDGNWSEEEIGNYGYVTNGENVAGIILVAKSKGDKICFEEKTNDGKWRMAGGNFAYTCDSRFSRKYGHPISIHDRIES